MSDEREVVGEEVVNLPGLPYFGVGGGGVGGMAHIGVILV